MASSSSACAAAAAAAATAASGAVSGEAADAADPSRASSSAAAASLSSSPAAVEAARRCVELLTAHARLLRSQTNTLQSRAPYAALLGPEWADALETLSEAELWRLPLAVPQHPLPASLLAFLRECHTLAAHQWFPRKQQQQQQHHQQPGSDGAARGQEEEREEEDKGKDGEDGAASQSRDVDFDTRGMTPKKIHEVALLSALVGDVARSTGASLVIDFGAGKGHLDHVVAGMKTPLCVLAIDRMAHTVEAANRRSTGAVHAVAAELSEPVDRARLADLLPEDWAGLADRAMVAGLHACAGLGVLCLRSMVRLGARGAVLVPCCHNLLTPADFPMSRAVREMALPPELRVRDPFNLACSSVFRLPADGPVMVERLLQRAYLEILLPDAFKGRGASVGRIRCDGFVTYATKALVRMRDRGMVPPATELPGNQALADGFALFRGEMHRRFCAYWALRATLGPVMEALVLLDRQLYLAEEGYESECASFFDPVLSPRAYVLVAQRRGQAVPDRPAHEAAASPGLFEIACQRPDDAVAVRWEGTGTAIFSITSPFGIGSATIRRTGPSWPAVAVVLRLHLQGLEGLTISTSLGEHVGTSHHEPAVTRLKPDAGFEFVVPHDRLAAQPDSITVHWVDFYRC